MSFTQFKNLGSVLQEYNLTAQRQNFVVYDKEGIHAPDRLIEDITFALQYIDYDSSEAAICESLIYPILVQVWKNFLDTLFLYSHRSWQADSTLTGIPDYLITAISKYGSPVIGTPVLITIEAKKDNFEEGWGQCAAAMVAAQQSNQNKQLVIYGIVSNGEQWEFGKLEQASFIKNIESITITDTHKLYAVLYGLLSICKQQLRKDSINSK